MMLSSHRAGRRRGYSLLEMIVVLAVVASFLAIALPAVFRPLAKAELRDAARQMEAALLGRANPCGGIRRGPGIPLPARRPTL